MGGVHLLIIAAYCTVADYLTGDGFGPATTLAMVIHGTIVLFTALKPVWAQSIKIAWAVYIASGIKIFTVDLKDSSVPEKMVAFLGIGIVLLFAGYQFQKLRTRQLEDA